MSRLEMEVLVLQIGVSGDRRHQLRVELLGLVGEQRELVSE